MAVGLLEVHKPGRAIEIRQAAVLRRNYGGMRMVGVRPEGSDDPETTQWYDVQEPADHKELIERVCAVLAKAMHELDVR